MVTRAGLRGLCITMGALFATPAAIAGCSSSPGGSGSPADAAVLGQADASLDGGVDLTDAGAAGADRADVDVSGSDGGAEAGPSYSCNPAALLDNPRPWDSCPGPSCVCYGYAPDAGSLAFDWSADIMSITAYQLPVPMKAGQPYSLSMTVGDNGFGGDVEFWGATSQCGPGWQELYSAPIASKVYCADVNPTQDYTFVLFVERMFTDSGAPAGESDYNHLACSTGRCNASP